MTTKNTNQPNKKRNYFWLILLLFIPLFLFEGQRTSQRWKTEQQIADSTARAKQTADSTARAKQTADSTARAKQTADSTARAKQTADSTARAKQTADGTARARLRVGTAPNDSNPSAASPSPTTTISLPTVTIPKPSSPPKFMIGLLSYCDISGPSEEDMRRKIKELDKELSKHGKQFNEKHIWLRAWNNNTPVCDDSRTDANLSAIIRVTYETNTGYTFNLISNNRESIQSIPNRDLAKSVNSFVNAVIQANIVPSS